MNGSFCVMTILLLKDTSLERIQEYIDIEQEPKPTPDGIPPAYWPSSGGLRVEKLCARYSKVRCYMPKLCITDHHSSGRT